MLARLQQREAAVRSEEAQIRPDDESPAVTLADQRAWLTVARRCAADLQGEVARLARATESPSCVCHDAHPRLQPIVETIVSQLGILESLVQQHQQAAQAAELSEEADDLARSQAELQRQVEHLLERRQAVVRSTKPYRRPIASEKDPGHNDGPWRNMQQLDQRRWQLQKEHAELRDELAALEPQLRDLRAERDAVDRQRAGLLSAPSIDALRGQLAAVQRQLECATHAPPENGVAGVDRLLVEASDFLAQLTDGGLVGIQLARHDHAPSVVDRDGRLVSLASLTNAQRHQVQLSTSLALAAVGQRKDVRLPLVLDEPFADFDAAAAAAMAAVLDDLGRRGQQVLVFTGHQVAEERFAALGVASHSMRHLRFAADSDEMLIDLPATSRMSKGLAPLTGQPVRGPRAPSGNATATNGRRRKPKN
jgi:DNA repair exonuclease SbcCD ATPase subunit